MQLGGHDTSKICLRLWGINERSVGAGRTWKMPDCIHESAGRAAFKLQLDPCFSWNLNGWGKLCRRGGNGTGPLFCMFADPPNDCPEGWLRVAKPHPIGLTLVRSFLAKLPLMQRFDLSPISLATVASCRKSWGL